MTTNAGRWLWPVAIWLLTCYPSACFRGEVNIQRPSTGDLLWGYEQLQRYLASRRARLVELRQEIQKLDVELLEKLGAMKASLETLQSMELVEGESWAERLMAERNLKRLKKESSVVYRRLLAAKRRKTRLDKEQLELPNQIAEDAKMIKKLNVDIAKIEKEIDVFRRAYDRTLNYRALQVARP